MMVSNRKKSQLTWRGIVILFLILILVNAGLILWNKYKVRPEESAKQYAQEGYKYYRAEDFVSAAEYYKKAIQLEPNNFDYYLNLGQSYFKLSDYSNSMIYYKKALEINPNNHIILAKIGSIYREIGKYDDAFHYYDLSLKIKPDYAYAFYGIGTTYFYIGDYNNALSHLLKAHDLNKQDKYTTNVLAAVYFLQSKYDSAINISNEELKYNPDSYTAFNSLGRSYLLKNDPKTAIFFYEKAITTTPKANLKMLSSINAALGIAYLKNRDFNNSFKYLNKSLSYFELPHAYAGLAAVHYFLGDFNKSDYYYKKMSFDKLDEVEKKIISVHFRNLGNIYLENNASEKAMQAYEIAAKLNPKDLV